MKSDPLITYRRKPATLDDKSLQSFAEVLRDRVARGREFHCRITNDAELRTLNAQFRGSDYATDVLSFPSPIADDKIVSATIAKKFRCGNTNSLGDIAVSFERARAQAREWRHSADDEIRILMLHGVLHLLGMDHESDSGRMKRAEIRWRRKLGLPVGLIERGAQ
jgi:probable rRNA maturation factor